ncbi:hypothetical protein FN846DRAFT_906534 [Sphaerosporella brunnea]|uniref:F-box domain-containing protein n=1 Tax=Sphaerosporella brunnea TaxID=1250544 RepID=A0A5J5EYM9_9PEZI|nr:hypothetical protein FN846DRAFT_906534 [Sphaerosporella brunnea]
MATLCGLRCDIHIEILSKLPALRSLAAAILTSRAIHQAFTIARHDVTGRVLDAEIPLASIIGEIDFLLPQDCRTAQAADHLSFANRYMLRYNRGSHIDLPLHPAETGSLVPLLGLLWQAPCRSANDEKTSEWTAIQRTVSALDLPVLYALLFPAFCTFGADVGSDLTWDRSWVVLFLADRTNRSDDSTAFPRRHARR